MNAPVPILSKHALQRCTEMGVTLQEVRDTIAHAQFTTPDTKHADRRRYFGDRYVVVLADSGIVITVLYRSDDKPFTRPEQEGR